ncbi:tail fiber domain-containing protein [Bergeyella cardium]|uniref:tail fiber domain-containing protein n=1 Tax=Bergeyella cardium TaxID=1585976 RepID=UPI000EA2BFDA|nr:tail fiber domain-containing protein [Bergeyella cardium]
MKQKLFFAMLLTGVLASAQTDYQGKVGINTEEPKATLDLNPSKENAAVKADASNEGLLIPRLSKERLAKVAPANLQESTLVYVNDVSYTGAETTVKNVKNKGFYFYNGTEWTAVIGAGASSVKTLYTDDGEISTDRTVTIKNAGSLVFKREAGNNNEAVDVQGMLKVTSIDMNSDRRLKREIQPITQPNSLAALRPVSYYWNVEGEKRGGNKDLQYGFIAQEIEQVYPHLVNTSSDGYKSVNYIQVIPLLVKELQESQAKLKDLEGRLEKLEGKGSKANKSKK